MSEIPTRLDEILIVKNENTEALNIDSKIENNIFPSPFDKRDEISKRIEEGTLKGDTLISEKNIFDQIVGLGYPYCSVKVLFFVKQISSLEEALDLLNKTDLGWIHPFVLSENQHDKCQICGEEASEHAEQNQSQRRRSCRYSLNRQHLNEGNKNFVTNFKLINNESIYKDYKEEKVIKDKIYSPIDIAEFNSCGICYEEIKEKQMHSLKCGHKFCTYCTNNYLDSIINSGAVLMIRCPQISCREEFSEDEIKRIVSLEYFEKYKRFKLNIEVNMNKRARWCPKRNCGKYALVKFGSKKCVCECGNVFCFNCGGAYHGWKSCGSVSDQKFQIWAKNKKIQKCPNCKILIHKDAGCNHMTCIFCQYQFCWICGMKCNDNHFIDPIFGCPFVQFTYSDWGFCRIFFYSILILMIWPLFSLITCVAMTVEFNETHFRACNHYGCLMCIFVFVVMYCFNYFILLTVGFLSHVYKIFYLVYRVIFLTT